MKIYIFHVNSNQNTYVLAIKQDFTSNMFLKDKYIENGVNFLRR